MNWLVALSTLALLVGLWITWWLHSQYRMEIVVEAGAQPAAWPMVSLIVPARNEQRNIRRCIEGLLAQNYPHFELIVMDDRSSDDTPRILAELQAANPQRLKILHGVELPPGWAGKPHALHQAAAAAQGEWLCFIDADTFAEPGLLAGTLAASERSRADLFTMLTFQELGSFWERVILPLVFTALSVGFSPRQVNDPKRPEAIANGQFILIRRAVYDAIGGHAAVRDQIVEDKALAERTKRAGYRLIVADGRAAASTRMYTNLAEIWEGWTKNIYLGMRDRLWLLLVGALVALHGALLLPLWLGGALLWWAQGGGWQAQTLALQATLLWTVLLAVRIPSSRAFGVSGWYALTLPLGSAVFAAMMLASAWKVVSGRGVTWKGRRYA